MQTTLLVSRQHTDGNGCGRGHYSLFIIISCEKSIDGEMSVVYRITKKLSRQKTFAKCHAAAFREKKFRERRATWLGYLRAN